MVSILAVFVISRFISTSIFFYTASKIKVVMLEVYVMRLN